MKLTRQVSLSLSIAIVSVILTITLAAAALSGRQVTLEYGDLRVEINNSQICELTPPRF